MVAFGGPPELAPRVHVLGPVRAWLGDAEIKLGSGGRRAVLSILAVRANETVSRAELIDGLWGDRPPVKAVGILHTYIHDLRRALDPHRGKRADSAVLGTVQTSYVLRMSDEQLDERLFAAHHEQARRQWAAGDLGAAVTALDAALALWQGDALHGVPGAFAETQRARLEESRITAVERRSALLLLRGDHETVVNELPELVAATPLRETARGLLMVALNHAGRRAEAVELYRDAERMLANEQGIEPSAALRRIHDDIVTGQPVSADAINAGIWTPRRNTERVITLSDTAQSASVPHPAPPPFLVGRDADVAWLRSLLRNLLDGRGDCVGVEGVQGIGKTALVATTFREPDDNAYAVVWGSLSDKVDDVVPRVERMCATRPLVFVVDDLHTADDNGLLVWHRLARMAQRLPLLVLGVFRKLPAQLRSGRLQGAVNATGGAVRTIGPLTADDVVRLAERRLGTPCGPGLRELLGAAAGNPSFAGELLDTITGSHPPRVTAGVVDLGADLPDPGDVLASLTRHRIRALTPATQSVLRGAALLGRRFDLTDLAAVVHAGPADLAVALEEAVGAGVLDDSDQHLAFRDTALPRALVEEWPAEARAAQRRAAAEALATAGAPVERVAAQLLEAAPVDAWTVRWVLANIEAVAALNQTTALDLLGHAVAGSSADEERHDALALYRVRLAFRLGQRPRAEAEAVLATTGDPELRWILAHLDYQAGAVDKAAEELRAAENDPAVPMYWRARYESLRAQFERGADDIGAAEQATLTALRHAVDTSDATAILQARRELWYFASVQRDHEAALAHAEAALDVVRDNPGLAQWHLNLLGGRAMSLQNLDRLDEATHTLARMRYIGSRLQPPAGRPHVATAVHEYWLGHWDEALAQLDLVEHSGDAQFHYPSAQSPLVQHGVAAMIAAHRGDMERLRAHLRAAEAYPVVTNRDREHSDYLVMARAFEAGIRLGEAAELDAVDPLLDPRYGRVTLRHQWLPRIMRLALKVGDQSRVAAVTRVSEMEASREVRPARAHTALRWCQALAARDPDGLLDVARHLRAVGRPVELAAALVDAAVALGEHHRTSLAALTFADASSTLTELGAMTDIARAVNRMRQLGVRNTGPTTGRRTVTGWGSLSDLERLIAEMFAAGTPYPDIAADLALSRRDVQVHLSGVMRKLRVDSRADLVDRIRRAPSRNRPFQRKECGGGPPGTGTAGRFAAGRGPRADPGVAR